MEFRVKNMTNFEYFVFSYAPQADETSLKKDLLSLKAPLRIYAHKEENVVAN